LGQEKFLLAMQMNKKAIDISTKSGNQIRQAEALNNKASIELALRASYNNIKPKDKISDFKQAYEIKKNNPQTATQSLDASFVNLVTSYAASGEISKIMELMQDRNLGIVEMIDVILKQINLSKSRISSQDFEVVKAMLEKVKLDWQNLQSKYDQNDDVDKTSQKSGSLAIITPEGYTNCSADGFCFYHAVLKQLRGSSCSAEGLQQLAINHILNHQDLYEQALNQIRLTPNDQVNDSELQVFLNEQLRQYDDKPNPWADELMLRALANALNIAIEVNMFNVDGTPQIHQTGELQGQNVVMQFLPETVITPGIERIVIGNIANVHFVTPNSNQISCTENDGAKEVEDNNNSQAEQKSEDESTFVAAFSNLNVDSNDTDTQNNLPGTDARHFGPKEFFGSW
jgi:hypothetical protein